MSFRVLPERAVPANEIPAQVQVIALRTLSGFLLTEPQAGLSHYEAIRAEDFSADNPFPASLDRYFTVVEQDTSQYWFSDRETLRDLLVQALEVQTALVVAQGLDCELGDDGSHPEMTLAQSLR